MKKPHYLYSIFSFLPLFLLAQTQEIPPTIGGAYETEKTECMSPEGRAEIQSILEKNIKALSFQNKEKAITEINLTSLGWPLKMAAGLNWQSYYAINNYVDQNTSSGILDYNCGARTYNGHGGVDIDTWPFPWYLYENDLVEVVAAEAGTIVVKSDGNDDDHCSCISPLWNAVYLMHSDGTITVYGHLKKNSLTSKSIGESVAKGEYLGIVASSGCSTQPHLHFEVYRQIPTNQSNLIDPFQGDCNYLNTSSWWEIQKPYREPTLNTVLTHSAPPVHGCPGENETPNISNTFLPGSTIYMATYYHDQLSGDISFFRILRPDNSVWQSWSHTSPNTYIKSWWYSSWILPENGPFGRWKFEVTYRSQTFIHEFDFVSVLPVKLTDFSGKVDGDNRVILSWQTSTEVDNDYFDVEYLENDNDFITIGRVRGAGTTASNQSYTFIHNNPAKTINYYRLKQVDFDGQYEYSKIIDVRLAPNSQIKVFPNPTSSIIDVIPKLAPESQIKVRDNTGRILLITKESRIDLSAYPNGLYFLEIATIDQITILKVIKH